MSLRDVIFPERGAYSFRIRVKGRTYDGPSLYLTDSEPRDEPST